MADRKRVRQLGDIRVTALDDGFDDLPIAVVVNIDEAGAAALAELSPGNDLLHPVFNAYLVETGGRRLLIDAGAGVHIGPNAGKMLENLAEAGVAPGDVDAIILTHCHPDHILGIVDGDWNAVFLNAELVQLRPGGTTARYSSLFWPATFSFLSSAIIANLQAHRIPTPLALLQPLRATCDRNRLRSLS
jgi:glyoxylase-like metal-dependent hydrolase (beta-lactamase superfamily II)